MLQDLLVQCSAICFENSRNCENKFIGLQREIGEGGVFTLGVIVYFQNRERTDLMKRENKNGKILNL
jgi:hypothetical protein